MWLCPAKNFYNVHAKPKVANATKGKVRQGKETAELKPQSQRPRPLRRVPRGGRRARLLRTMIYRCRSVCRHVLVHRPPSPGANTWSRRVKSQHSDGMSAGHARHNAGVPSVLLRLGARPSSTTTGFAPSQPSSPFCAINTGWKSQPCVAASFRKRFSVPSPRCANARRTRVRLPSHSASIVVSSGKCCEGSYVMSAPSSTSKRSMLWVATSCASPQRRGDTCAGSLVGCAQATWAALKRSRGKTCG